MDGNTDDRHEELRAMVNNVIELYPTAFAPFLFNTKDVEAHLIKSMVTGMWAEMLDIMACATLLRRKIFLYSQSLCKWLKFEPLSLPDLNKKVPIPSLLNCMCPVTLSYFDFDLLSNNFNLLPPIGPCCETPEPKNNFETTTIYLDNDDHTDTASKEYIPKNKTNTSTKLPHRDDKNNSYTKNSRATTTHPKSRQKNEINLKLCH